MSSIDLLEIQREKRRAESEAARDSDEIWTPIAAGATAGSGGGGGSELGGVTTIWLDGNTSIHSDVELIDAGEFPAGKYLVSAQGCFYAYEGQNGGIHLYLIDDQDTVIADAWSCIAIPDSGEKQATSIAPVLWEPGATRSLSLRAVGSLAYAMGTASGTKGTFVTVEGPITV